MHFFFFSIWNPSPMAEQDNCVHTPGAFRKRVSDECPQSTTTKKRVVLEDITNSPNNELIQNSDRESQKPKRGIRRTGGCSSIMYQHLHSLEVSFVTMLLGCRENWGKWRKFMDAYFLFFSFLSYFFSFFFFLFFLLWLATVSLQPKIAVSFIRLLREGAEVNLGVLQEVQLQPNGVLRFDGSYLGLIASRFFFYCEGWVSTSSWSIIGVGIPDH